MIDLDREMRALLDDEARRTPPLPGAASTLRRTRRRQAVVLLASFAVVVAVAVGSVAGASALIRSTERGIPADEHLTPAPVACPAGSTPDRPGPVDQARPGKGAYSHASMAFDSASHRMMMLTNEQTLWAFDVCTNTWARATGPGGPTLARLVYDVGSGRMLAIQRDNTLNVLRAWAYDAAARTWTARAAVEGGIAFAKETPQAVYDPTIAAVIVRDWATQRMWTYEVEANAWTELDTGPTLPPYVGGSHPQLLTYDDTVDRLVLYVGSETAGHETWTFDLEAHRWTHVRTDTPVGNFGWVPSGDEMVYDASAGVSLLAAGPTLATYDASTARWDVRSTEDPNPAGSGYPMAYDSLNHRIVTAHDDVVAYDVAAGRWTRLLAPSSSAA